MLSMSYEVDRMSLVMIDVVCRRSLRNVFDSCDLRSFQNKTRRRLFGEIVIYSICFARSQDNVDNVNGSSADPDSASPVSTLDLLADPSQTCRTVTRNTSRRVAQCHAYQVRPCA